MIKRLISHGNSAALIIAKPIMELLGITTETALEITTDGRNLVISPISGPGRNKKFRSALNKINKEHADTLRKLAQ